MRHLLNFVIIYWDFVSPEGEILLSSKAMCGLNCFFQIISVSKVILFQKSIKQAGCHFGKSTKHCCSCILIALQLILLFSGGQHS